MMVGTANDTKSEPASTSNRMTAFTRPTRATCTRSSRGLTAAVEAPGDVVGQRQASLHDGVALALELASASAAGSPSVRNMSGTSAYSEFDRDDESAEDGWCHRSELTRLVVMEMPNTEPRPARLGTVSEGASPRRSVNSARAS